MQGSGNVPVRLKRELKDRLWLGGPVEAIPGSLGQAD